MRLAFDLDGTLCDTPDPTGPDDLRRAYSEATPIKARIRKLNALYDSGDYYIIIDTARGAGSGQDFRALTERQLDEWGVKYHELHVGEKPWADTYIDDRSMKPEEWEAA